MRAFTISLDERTHLRLLIASREIGRSIEDLIESAAEEAANNFFRHRPDDPANPCKAQPSV